MRRIAFIAAICTATSLSPTAFSEDTLPPPFHDIELPEGRMLVYGDGTCPEGTELADGNGNSEINRLMALVSEGGRCPDMPIVRMSHGVTFRADTQNYCVIQARDTRTADLSYCVVSE